MKYKLRQIWKWLNGKKTTIGTIGLLSLKLSFIKSNLDPNLYNDFEIAFSLLATGGLLHKGVKNKDVIKETVNTNINKAKQLIKK